MRIFSSPDSDPMLLDHRDGLLQLHSDITRFLASSAMAGDFPAKTDGSPAPYNEFLGGLHILKSDEPLILRRNVDSWLDVRGNTAALRAYFEHLQFPLDDPEGHHHPDHDERVGPKAMNSLRLIMEADSTWPGEEH